MSLPQWASVHIDKKTNVRKDWEPTTARSEELLRQRSVKYWSSRIDQAQRKTWDDLCQDGLERFQEFCHISDTLEDENDTRSVPSAVPQHQEPATTTKSNDTLYARLALEPSAAYPSDLLPCLIVNPPPTCKLDRQAMMQSIYLKQKKATRKTSDGLSKGTATILLPRLLPTLRQTLSLVWRQIIQQEPNRTLSRFASKRLNKNRRTQSLQKWILWWASRTERFDRLVILLEDPGETEIRESFYRCLGAWRQEEGLPVSLIVMGTHEQVRDLCLLETRIQIMSLQDSTTQYYFSGPMRWICQFLRNLILDETTLPPPVSWGKIMLKTLEDFRYLNGSCTQFVQQLRAHVVNFFACSKGSFAWDLPTDEDRRNFLAWFCTYEGAKEYLDNSSSGREKYKALDRCVRIQGELRHFWRGMTIGLPLFLHFGKSESESSVIANTAIPILGSLYHWIQKQSDNSDSSPLESLKPLQQVLDPSLQIKQIRFEKSEVGGIKRVIQELIILIHSCNQSVKQDETIHVDEEMINSGLIDMIQDLFKLVGEQIDIWLEQWMEECPLLATEKTLDLTNEICIRRETIQDLPQPAKSMYELLQDRLSIKREDWMYDFGGTADDFMLGVWMLTVAGLVQAKRIRGGGILYEKVAVVWTSRS